MRQRRSSSDGKVSGSFPGSPVFMGNPSSSLMHPFKYDGCVMCVNVS